MKRVMCCGVKIFIYNSAQKGIREEGEEKIKKIQYYQVISCQRCGEKLTKKCKSFEESYDEIIAEWEHGKRD